MANEKKLDCAILGLLSHQDLTGYEIKKCMDGSLRFFWGASFGSIYPTLKELADKGFAVKVDTPTAGDRNQIKYAITEQGRAHLRKWLEVPVVKDELRYETLLKLFFANEAGVENAIKHIENFEEKINRELPIIKTAVEQLESVCDEDSTHLYYLLTAKFGVKTYEAYLEWCEQAKEVLRKQEGNTQ